MRTTIKLGAALVTAALAGSVYYATTASAGPSNPDNTAGGSAGQVTSTATIPPRVFAVVNADGTKLRGKAVGSTSRLSTGSYEVIFNRNISSCAWTGTPGVGGFGGSVPATMISVSGRAGTNNGVFVQTFNTAGTPTDEAFGVVVVCS